VPSDAKRARLRRALAGGARGLAFGMGANIAGLRFVPAVIARFTPLPWALGVVALILLAWAQGLVWWAAAIARVQLVRVRVPAALAFALAVYAASFVPAIFPWTPAGGVTAWPRAIQLADVIGERGVGFLVALASGLLGEAARALLVAPVDRRRAVIQGILAIALPLAMVAHGATRMARVEAIRANAKSATVALVQPSIGATERWEAQNAPRILDKLTSLTLSAERHGAALTVWTESAYPYILTHAGRRSPIGTWSILGPGVHGPIISGAVTSAGHGDSYNSALVATSDGAVSEPYDKLHLLWFGESVPLAAELPWIRRTFARGIGMVPGERSVVLSAGDVRAGILICFEDILPGAGREAAGASPNLLVNLSNDAWFTGSDESELHLRLSVLRAVETRRDLVRAVNFGPTSWVDAAGIIRARYADPLAGILLTSPALLETPPTLYTRFGDLPFALALLVLAIVGRGMNHEGTKDTKA
jgi:apolipoprotein N-acyltransferase